VHNNKKIFLLCATKQGLDLINLINKDYKITCVITPKINKNSPSERISAKNFCKEKKINFKEIKNYSNLDEIKDYLQNEKIDILICISWQRIIPEWLIKLPKIACLGSHGSHQGMYLGRGRSPMNWSILAGEKSFTISLFKITKNDADSGPEIFNKKIEISLTDNINDFYIKCHLVLSQMILKFLKDTKNINLKKYTGKYRFLPKITPAESFIDWTRSDIDIYNFIRSKTSPYPSAFTYLNKKLLEIKSAQLIKVNFNNKYNCGEIAVILSDKRLLISVRNGFLAVEINKKDISRIKEGQIFKSANFKKQMKTIINRHYKINPMQKLNQIIIKLSK
tara:strand:- start:3789 stop:4796 length:1008 start_codon:yes stop_codon:yes gene_type:complete